MAKKFDLGKAQEPTSLKSFQPPAPKFQTKPSVIIGKAVVQGLQKTFIKTGTETEDKAVSFSKILNTPIFSDITFSGSQYVDENGNTVTFESLTVQLCLLTVVNMKNIVETTLQGRDGTVKEYISSGDWQVKIDGKIYGDGANNYPQDDVQKLIKICMAPQSITVTSDFLKMFDISSLVIRQQTIPQLEGIRNYQEFSLNCLSDKELILLKNA